MKDGDKLIVSDYNLRLRSRVRLEEVVDDDFPSCDSDEWSIDADRSGFMGFANDVSDSIDVGTAVKKRSRRRGGGKSVKKQEKTSVRCDICGWQSASVRSCERHKMLHFTQVVYQCRDCETTFRKADALVCHIKCAHLDAPPPRHDCAVCGKSVRNIAIHMLQHTDARFACEACPRRFVKQSVYEEHLLVHATAADARTHRCDICHASYSRKWNWKVHMDNHEKRRDADGRYLPLKPRGRAHWRRMETGDDGAAVADATTVERDKWANVDRCSKACDTSSLERCCSSPDMRQSFPCDQSVDTDASVDVPSGTAWETALFSSRACDTADIEFYEALLRQIGDD